MSKCARVLILLVLTFLSFSDASAKKAQWQQPPPTQQVQPRSAEPQVVPVAEAPASVETLKKPWVSRSLNLLTGLLGGLVAGALMSQKLRTARKWFVYASLAGGAFMMAATAIAAHDRTALFLGMVVGGVIGWFLLRERATEDRDVTLGSASWATEHELERAGVIDKLTQELKPQRGLVLGVFPGKKSRPMHYSGSRHLLTFGPNRSGKGTTALIPNLLTYLGSALIIDIKGEAAIVTSRRRGPGADGVPGMNQKVHIVDPFGIASVPGMKASRFNPIDWVIGDPKNATENAMLLAESLVPMGETKEPFWNEQARSLLTGLILYVAFDPAEKGRRTLGRVRDLLVAAETERAEIFARMMATPHPVARSTAACVIGQDEKLRANTFSTAQSHTHFLDSSVIRESLSASDLAFGDLKRTLMTVYLVLPPDRLDTFGRWLRLLIQLAIIANARDFLVPKAPVLLLMDEMAALGHLPSVERAFGLMAGMGLQLWGFFQDAAQAKRIYGDGWETFVGNSGVVQYFGSLDHSTAEYMSKLCGVTTIVKHSLTHAIVAPFTWAAHFTGMTSEQKPQSTTRDIVQRHLCFPDELMRMRDPNQLLFIEGCNPVRAHKLPWFKDPERRTLGVNLHAPGAPTPPAPPPAPAPAPERVHVVRTDGLYARVRPGEAAKPA